MKYTITIEETAAKDFEIEANSAEEAYKTAEGREDYLIRLCMVVDWRIDHPEWNRRG